MIKEVSEDPNGHSPNRPSRNRPPIDYIKFDRVGNEDNKDENGDNSPNRSSSKDPKKANNQQLNKKSMV